MSDCCLECLSEEMFKKHTFILPIILTYPFSSIVAKSLQMTKHNKIQNNYHLQRVRYLKQLDHMKCLQKVWKGELISSFLQTFVMTDLPRVEPTAGLNAGVSLFLIFPVSQHDVVSSKADLPGSINRYYTTVVIHDFRLEKAETKIWIVHILNVRSNVYVLSLFTRKNSFS